jgi:hypothetical protein
MYLSLAEMDLPGECCSSQLPDDQPNVCATRGPPYGCCGHFLKRGEDILHVLLGQIGELLSMVYRSASFARPRLDMMMLQYAIAHRAQVQASRQRMIHDRLTFWNDQTVPFGDRSDVHERKDRLSLQ